MKRIAVFLGSATCVAAAFALTAVTALAANPVIDPGFELGVGWNTFNGAAYSTAFAHSGTSSMADTTQNNVPGSFEQFPATAGDLWSLSGYGLTPSPLLGGPFGGVSFGILQLTFFDSANNNLGTIETSPGNAATSSQINETSTAGVWIPLTVSAHAPAGAAYGQIFTLVVDFGSPAPEGVYFDDIDLAITTVPEPTTLALAGLGAAALLIRRRRN